MPYTDVETVDKILDDDFLRFPADMTPYFDFAEAEINSRLAGQYDLPFDDVTKYTTVPVLIKWIASYLIGYKLYDKATSTQELADNNAGQKWWDMADRWLSGIVEGVYLLHLEDGTVVEIAGSTTGPRSYPSGVRDKAPSADNVPFFNREQAGQW